MNITLENIKTAISNATIDGNFNSDLIENSRLRKLAVNHYAKQIVKSNPDSVLKDYVDMSISSTINLPQWGSMLNNEETVDEFTNTLASYAHRLRGFTVSPDGCRGGQPLSSVPYSEAVEKLGEEFEEGLETHDICDITGHGGSCGV